MGNDKEMYKKKSKEAFDKQANSYESTFNGNHAKKLYSSVIEKVNKLNCRKLLDVGCGTGTILSELNENISLSGIDLSDEMLNIAKQKLNDRVELKNGDSAKLPWENETFDTIICTDSFHHYPEPEKVLNEMIRVLQDEGSLIIGDPWIMSPFRQIFNLFSKYNKEGDYRIYSKSDISKLLVKCGFNSVKWNRVNYNSFIVTAKVSK